MSDIFRDPMWQFVAVLLTAIAILVSISLYLKQRRRKALSYSILSQTPLLSVKEEIKKELKILYNGKPVEQVHLIMVKIINSGNTPILSTDYERPISLNFGEKANVLTAAIVKMHPDSIQASFSVEGKNVVFTPTLLNAGDSFTLKMLITKLGEVKVDGRIVGVKEIQESKESPRNLLLLTALAGTVQILGVFLMQWHEIFRWISVGSGIFAIYFLTRYVRHSSRSE